ncbi:MAG: methionine adenosyltransferase [Candidatus Spechtbacteria bacterium]|nr:methionine adenosyltransferase [Candidatus Spechtbacteria bacterium]
MRIYHNQTIESITEGHPDKICDQISDAILDAYLAQDPASRVAIETFGAHGTLTIGGEITSQGEVNAETIARSVYKKIGYDDELAITQHVVRQSPDIARGVDTGGAGDQGIMYGYACDETPEFLPRTYSLVRRITAELTRLRKEDPSMSWLRPDGKAQITMLGDKIQTIVVSMHHAKEISQEEIRDAITKKILKPILGSIDGIDIFINPAGPFTIGGFAADTGLTGRKIAVDSYGGLVPMGGGCFSGKDPTKVDRSGAYMARFVAKNLVASGLTKECLVGVAYAIGKADPVMLFVESFDNKGEDLTEITRKNFDFRPNAIIERLQLRQPIYQATARNGHFGDTKFPWEKIVSIA